MRICVLHSPESEADAVRFDRDGPDRDPSRYMPEHSFDHARIEKARAARQIEELTARGYDAFVNLCDGVPDEEDVAGIEVVEALERLGVAFTGASSAFYEPTRERMKEVCLERGIRTPAFAFAHDLAAAEEVGRRLRFPLIVKHHDSYASVGLTPASRVEDAAALREQAARMIARFGGTLIEEFIEGRELTALVVENPDEPARPLVLQPLEVLLPPGESFKHFHLKWVDYDTTTWAPSNDEGTARRIEDMTRAMFLGLSGDGYGRCDFRMDRDGALYLLEINPNCGIFYAPETPGSADAILAADPMGARGFVAHILRCAEQRRRPR